MRLFYLLALFGVDMGIGFSLMEGGALGSFKNGLMTLPKAVAKDLGEDRVRLQWQLKTIAQNDAKEFVAVFSTPEGEKTVVTKSLALTAPAYVTSSVLAPLIGEEAASRLDEVKYPCVYSVTLAYPKDAFKKPLSGFGNLIPRSMGITTLGTIWSSCLFPGRAPEGMELLLSYIGIMADPVFPKISAQHCSCPCPSAACVLYRPLVRL